MHQKKKNVQIKPPTIQERNSEKNSFRNERKFQSLLSLSLSLKKKRQFKFLL